MPSTDWRSIGTALPLAALAQPASRNSWLVAVRSWARVRTRSGSHATSSGALGQHVEEGLHAVDEGGGERLHALDGDALAELLEQVGGAGQPVGERGGPLAHGVGEQQLAARRRPQAVLGDLERALVGDLEPADLLDGVAPELEPERVLLGGREDVEDAAAHGELAAALDEVGAGVGGRREVLDDLLERRLVAGLERDRAQVAQALGDRLEHGAHRRDDDRRAGRGCRRRRRGARAGAAPTGAGRRCRCAGSAARAGGSPTRGTARRRPAPRLASRAAWRSSASRPVAVTASTGAPERGRGQGRDDDGPGARR